MAVINERRLTTKDNKILQSEKERLKSMLSGKYSLSDGQRIMHLTRTLQIVLDILDKIMGE